MHYCWQRSAWIFNLAWCWARRTLMQVHFCSHNLSQSKFTYVCLGCNNSTQIPLHQPVKRVTGFWMWTWVCFIALISIAVSQMTYAESAWLMNAGCWRWSEVWAQVQIHYSWLILPAVDHCQASAVMTDLRHAAAIDWRPSISNFKSLPAMETHLTVWVLIGCFANENTFNGWTWTCTKILRLKAHLSDVLKKLVSYISNT